MQGQVPVAVPTDVHILASGVTPTVKQGHLRTLPQNLENMEVAPSQSSAISSSGCKKSLPYILILGIKLVMQHITGISLGIGLLTTFMYANKSIVNQVFLRERSSKIQCAWLLVFLAGSSILLYYTFQSQSLYYSLIFLNPTLDQLSFWEVLWIVGITDFILKFFFMGLKCLILLVPDRKSVV